MTDQIRVLIVDDDALVRAGLSMLLAGADDIAVVGEATDGNEVMDAVSAAEPDIVLMDIRMPTMDGLAATALLRATDQPPDVIVLTTFEADDYVLQALRAGASGFLLKDVRPEDLLAAVRIVAGGDALIAPAVTRRLIEHFVRAAPPAVPPAELSELTAREVEVLMMVARGLSNGEIAADLVLSEATVKTHVKHILAKLNARDRVQAVVFAYEAGLVAPGD